MIKIFKNPFYTYIASFAIVLILYSFGWSGINPSLSISLLLFFLGTFIVAFVLGFIFDKHQLIAYQKINENRTKRLLVLIVIIYTLYGIEIIINNDFPLWSLLKGEQGVNYKLFGVKYIHLIAVTLNSFYLIYAFHCYLSNRSTKLLLLYIVAYIPAFIIMNRGIIIIGALSSFFVFVQYSKGKLSRIQLCFLVTISVFIMFVFGFLGNLRVGANSFSDTSIYHRSKADELFMDSTIPREFYWTYLYTTSPMSIFQNTINKTEEFEYDFFSLTINECLPDIVSKRANKVIELNNPKSKLVVYWLTADSVYSKSYMYAGWLGPIFMFLYMSGFIILVVRVIPKGNEFHTSAVAILMTLIFLNVFSNMFNFSGISLMFVYPIFGGIIIKKIQKLKKHF